MRYNHIDLLPINAFRPRLLNQGMTLEGGGGGFIESISDAVSGIGDAIGFNDAIETIGDLGAQIDDTVNDVVPGGWVTVGAVALGGAGLAFAPEIAAGLAATEVGGATGAGLVGDAFLPGALTGAGVAGDAFLPAALAGELGAGTAAATTGAGATGAGLVGDAFLPGALSGAGVAGDAFLPAALAGELGLGSTAATGAGVAGATQLGSGTALSADALTNPLSDLNKARQAYNLAKGLTATAPTQPTTSNNNSMANALKGMLPTNLPTSISDIKQQSPFFNSQQPSSVYMQGFDPNQQKSSFDPTQLANLLRG